MNSNHVSSWSNSRSGMWKDARDPTHPTYTIENLMNLTCLLARRFWQKDFSYEWNHCQGGRIISDHQTSKELQCWQQIDLVHHIINPLEGQDFWSVGSIHPPVSSVPICANKCSWEYFLESVLWIAWGQKVHVLLECVAVMCNMCRNWEQSAGDVGWATQNEVVKFPIESQVRSVR